MTLSIKDIPESSRVCPLCSSDSKIVRAIKYGSNNCEEQIKLECTKCKRTWLYHTDSN